MSETDLNPKEKTKLLLERERDQLSQLEKQLATKPMTTDQILVEAVGEWKLRSRNWQGVDLTAYQENVLLDIIKSAIEKAREAEIKTYLPMIKQEIARKEHDATCQSKFKPQSAAGLTFQDLRRANIDRDEGENGWHERGEWSLNDWGVAVAGEVGEMLNVIKKFRRGDFTIDEARPQIADELADILTYLDLLADTAGIDTATALIKKFNEVSERIGSKVVLSQNPHQ